MALPGIENLFNQIQTTPLPDPNGDDKQFSLDLLNMQRKMQQEAQLFQTASNILNMRHQMAMDSLSKVGQSGRG